MLNDLRYAIRMLLKSPGFTAVAVITLALGIGLCTTIFSAVNPILFRPLPFEKPLDLVYVSASGRGFTQLNLSYADFVDWRRQNHVFEDLGIWSGWSPTIGGGGSRGELERPQGAHVSPTLFSILGIDPILGRHFTAAEDQPGAPAVVIISHALWQRRFGADVNVVGQTLLVDGEPATIIGVMPAEFGFPTIADLWSPLIVTSPQNIRGSHSYSGIARLRPGVTLSQAMQDLTRVTDELGKQYPGTNSDVRPYLRPLRDEFLGSNISIGWITLIAVCFVLAVACANVANLFLARALGRQKEFAIRGALGASRWQTIRQLLVESVLLAGVSGVLGFVLSGWGLRLVLSLLGDRPPLFVRFDVDGTVLGFVAGISLLTCLLFGLAPAWHAAGISVQEGLKEASKSAGHGRGRSRLRDALVILEVALAVLLLAGAGLMIRTVINLQSVAPGFNPNRLLVCNFNLPFSTYNTPARRSTFYSELLNRLAVMPGVESAGAVSNLPMGGGNNNFSFSIEGRPAPQAGQLPTANTRVVTPDYFATMRIPILKGRGFKDADADGVTKVAVVEDAFARRFFHDEDPIGKRIKPGEVFEIVGVVGDVRHHGLDQGIPPGMYLAHRQNSWGDMSVVIRTTAENPLTLVSGVRAVVREMDPGLWFEPTTMDQIVQRSYWVRRFLSQLFGAFSILALALAAVGIAAVVAYSVSQRTHEIGVRMAVGAGRGDVLWLIIRQGMIRVSIGLLVGLVASLGLTRVLSSELYGVGGGDPLTLLGSAAVFGIIGLAACYVPGRRAARVDPMTALRSE